VRLDLFVEIAKLRIPIRVLLAFQRFGVALQAETLGAQQVGHSIRRDPLAGQGQFLSQLASRLGGPPQRRFRITPHVRLDQRQQRRPASTSASRFRPPPGRRIRATRTAPESTSSTPAATVCRLTPRRSDHHRNPTMPQGSRLRPQIQPLRPLVQMRQQRRELRRQHLLNIHDNGHTTP
jgi:hypothetical protein